MEAGKSTWPGSRSTTSGTTGSKIGSTDDVTVVGTDILNVHHKSYQTETSPEDAASCGHDADDLFHHSDGIQIYPGGVNRMLVSDSYVQTRFMWQVAAEDSCRDLQVQRSMLDAGFGDCQTINTRVKSSAGDAEMDVTVLDTDSYCDNARVDNPYLSGAPKWHFITLGTDCPNHTLRTDDVEFFDTAAPESTPADAWRQEHPFSTWGCFLQIDVGWDDVASNCTGASSFPSVERLGGSNAQPFEHHACNGAYD